jgi:hypothetical protein
MRGDGGRMKRAVCAAIGMAMVPTVLSAHAGEQSFVLLLPTDFYIAAGVAVVAMTVVLVAMIPAGLGTRIFAATGLGRCRSVPGQRWTSLVSFVALMILIRIGLTGTQNPTANLLPLTVWTLIWIGLVLTQGVIGDLWSWVNPWEGPVAVIRWAGVRPVGRLPSSAGQWPAVMGLISISAFLLADPAPSDPTRLAGIVLGWWAFHFAGAVILGPRWLQRAEPMGVMMRAYATLSPFGSARGRWQLGLPGWKVLARPVPGLSMAVFVVGLLAAGSYDGLYETFWWLGLTGINPLEYPGRTAVAGQSLTGLLLALPALLMAYGAMVWLGARLAGVRDAGRAFCALAPSLLPIAFAYHAAHYLPAFLVDAQHAAIAFNDPLGNGANLLGLSEFQVTTGFFNRLTSVRVIWLTQAGLVVTGHVFGILISHAIALRLTGDGRRATVMQMPLAAFMVLYTLFGLWLLAAPRGV